MVEVWASKTILRICYKFSSIYFGIKGAAARKIVKYGPKDLAAWLNNLSLNSGGGQKSKRVTKGCSLQRRLQLQTEVNFGLIFYKDTLSNKLADPLIMEKLKL